MAQERYRERLPRALPSSNAIAVVLVRQERGDRILRDLLRRIHNMKANMDPTVAEHVVALAGARPAQTFKVELKRAYEEVAQLSTELTAERASQEEAEESEETYQGEAKKLQAMLLGRDEELNIVHAQLSASEISCVQAKREHDSLLVEMQAVIEEKDDTVRAKSDLEDDWVIALEEARYAVTFQF